MSLWFKPQGLKVELRFCSFLECVHFSTAGTDKEKLIKHFIWVEDSMMHTVLNYFSSVVAYFPKYSTFSTCKKNPKFLEIWTKLQMSKWEETLSILEDF